jgi:hypothetical protein
MSGRVTPHLIAAGIILLVAILISLAPLLQGSGDYQVLVTNPRVADRGADLLPASAATDAVVAPYVRLPDGNPFTLRKTGTVRGPRISLPPPPPLTPPSPPVLPLPELQ